MNRPTNPAFSSKNQALHGMIAIKKFLVEVKRKYYLLPFNKSKLMFQ
jgi:hypothetical protein